MIHVWEFGPQRGHPIVALHGLKGYGGRWRRVATLVEPRGLRVSAPDLRGHGRSSFAGPWTLEQHARDVLGLPLFREVQRVDVIGQSLGGAVAVMMASLAPQHIGRMVLLDPAIGVPAEVAARNAANEGPPPLFDSPAAAALARARSWPAEADGQVDAEVREHLRRGSDGRWRWRYHPDMAVASHHEVARPLDLPSGIPVLVLRGLRGGVPVRQAEQWRVAGATVVNLDCGHQVYLERPAEVAAAISEFLTFPAAAPHKTD